MPPINLGPRVRFWLYIVGSLASLGVVYAVDKSWAGDAETRLVQGIVALLGILAAANTNTAKPEEQARMQRRMQAWAKLTPEQRRQARESYKNLAKTQPSKRQKLREQWAEYQALTPREREELVPQQEKKPRR